MIDEEQKNFYALVGRALTVARQRRSISVAQLSQRSGEHHKTIRGIEAGRPFYAHHTVWMREVLGLEINIVKSEIIEGKHEHEEIKQGSRSLNDYL